jgi:NAD(P)H-flavin reductase/ferredoxin
LVAIRYGKRVYDCRPSETVLEALRRQGVELAYSCTKGTCQTCMLRADGGAVPPEAQAELKDTLRAQGYFLPCVCVPGQDLELSPPDGEAGFFPALAMEIERLADDVCRLRLRQIKPLSYRAGQFIHLRRADGLLRSYSLASVPGRDRDLELHVKHLRGGRMTTWIFQDLRPGERVEIRGPNGSCFYTEDRPEQPLLLIGTGTGLAPLMGIARDALNKGHKGPIHLYHGTRDPAGLYQKLELEWWATQYENFHFVPCLSGVKVPRDCRMGRAEEVAFAEHPDLSGWRVFLCGCPPMVHAAKKRAYLAGAALADIHADPFELRDLGKSSKNRNSSLPQ